MNPANYYSYPALSASGINRWYESPLHYWRESPFNPEATPREQTPAMLFGSLCHKLVLEPDTFEQEYVVAPKIDKRSNAGKAAWAAFEQESTGQVAVTQEQYDNAAIMRDALWKNEAVCKLLGNGSSEHPIFWDRENLKCKAKIDYYREGLLLDYKTSACASPQEFAKSLVNLGYHRQAAWYFDGIETVYNERPRGFVFIVQDKTLPDAIGIYSIDDIAVNVGREENAIAAEDIARRLNDNEWEAFPSKIVQLGLPVWYMKKFNNGEL